MFHKFEISIYANAILTLLFLQSVRSLEPEKPSGVYKNGQSLRKVLNSLANVKSFLTNDVVKSGRRSDDDKPALRTLQEKYGIGRQFGNGVGEAGAADEPAVDKEREKLVIEELEDAEEKHVPAAYAQAYLEQRGHNDFLVFKSKIPDDFVTVIPNNIYYGNEKKCVNWMDDCSLQGIRSRLLQAVGSPVRK